MINYKVTIYTDASGLNGGKNELTLGKTKALSREEFCGLCSVRGGNKMKLQSDSSCFSREEFKRGFAPFKGDDKKNYRATARATVTRNLPINFLFHRAQLLKCYLWAEGTVK